MKLKRSLGALMMVLVAVACRRDASPTDPDRGPSYAVAAASVPALLAPANGESVTVPLTISWTQVLDPSAINGGYNWQVSTSSTFSSLVLQDATRPSETQDVVSGLPNGTYFWRVNAVDAALNVSAW